jgi:hypothetical protein
VQAGTAHEMPSGAGRAGGMGVAVRRDRGRDVVGELWDQPAGPMWMQQPRDLQRGRAAHPETVSTVSCTRAAALYVCGEPRARPVMAECVWRAARAVLAMESING